MEDVGPEPRSLWCPRTRSPLCLCDSLTIPRQLTSSQRATVSNSWPQFTHSLGSIAPLSGQQNTRAGDSFTVTEKAVQKAPLP